MSLVASSHAERREFMERHRGELQSRQMIADSSLRVMHVNSAEALEALPANTAGFVHVELGCCPLTNGLFEKILEISTLIVHLDLSGNGNLGKRLKEWLSSSQSNHQNESFSFPRLETLTMAGNSLDDESVMIICRMVASSLELTRINLRFNSISDYGLQSLSHIAKTLSKLSEIDLSCNNIGDDGIQAICQILEETKQLRKISLAHNRLSDASNIFKSVKKSTLQSLDLSGNQLFGKPSAVLPQQLFWPSSLTLKDLSISSTGLNDQVCTTLFEFLTKSSNINRLDVSNNLITDAVAEGICTYLACSQSLIVELNMEGNYMSQSVMEKIMAVILMRDLKHRVTLRFFNEKSTTSDIEKIRLMIKESKNARKWNLNAPPYVHISRETTDAILLQALEDVETSVFEIIEQEESRLIQLQNRGTSRSINLGPRLRQSHDEGPDIEDVNAAYKDSSQPAPVGLQDFVPNEDLWDYEEPEGRNYRNDLDDEFGGELLIGSSTNFGAQLDTKTTINEAATSPFKPEQETNPPASPLRSPARIESMSKHNEDEDEWNDSQESVIQVPDEIDPNVEDIYESSPTAGTNKSQTEASLDHSLDSILQKIEIQDITSAEQEVESPSQQERNRSKSQLDDVIEQMESVLRESSLKTETQPKSPTIDEESRESLDAHSEENIDASENHDVKAPQEQETQFKLNKRPNLHIEVPVIETPVLHPITTSLTATPESTVRQTPTQLPDQGAGTVSSVKSLSRQQPSSSVSLKRDTMLASLKNEEYKATILNYKSSKRKAKIVVSLEGAWMRVRKEPTLFKSAKPIQDFNLQSVTFEEWGTTTREIALHSSLLAQPWIIRIKSGSEGPFKLSLQTRGAQKTSS